MEILHFILSLCLSSNTEQASLTILFNKEGATLTSLTLLISVIIICAIFSCINFKSL